MTSQTGEQVAKLSANSAVGVGPSEIYFIWSLVYECSGKTASRVLHIQVMHLWSSASYDEKEHRPQHRKSV